MKLRHPLFTKAAAFLGATALRHWMGTLDYRAVYYDPTVDAAHPDCGRNIYVFWHEYIPFVLPLRGHCNLSVLISQHHDGELISRAAAHLGFGSVRGSTTRGGAAAILDMLRTTRRGHLVITPDGPRGPRRVLAPGAIYVAARSGLPIVPLGFGYDRPWRTRSWDRFAIPRPFSRACAVAGPRIVVPSDLDRAGIEAARRSVEATLNLLTSEAEAWAESGTRKVGETVPRPAHPDRPLLRRDEPTVAKPPHFLSRHRVPAPHVTRRAA